MVSVLLGLPWKKEEIAVCIWFWLKYVGGVGALGEGDSIRSGGAWGCFCLGASRESLLGLTKELSPDSICKAPLILKSDSFWFTRLFIFVSGSLWALFGCGVACLGETSGFGRPEVYPRLFSASLLLNLVYSSAIPPLVVKTRKLNQDFPISITLSLWLYLSFFSFACYRHIWIVISAYISLCHYDMALNHWFAWECSSFVTYDDVGYWGHGIQ